LSLIRLGATEKKSSNFYSTIYGPSIICISASIMAVPPFLRPSTVECRQPQEKEVEQFLDDTLAHMMEHTSHTEDFTLPVDIG
jgi:hypothetical protein